MAEPVLQVQGLSISHQGPDGGIPLVSDLSFEIAAGEIVGMVGESGSGKTITALALMGLLSPPLERSGGRVRLQGRDLSTLEAGELNRLRGDVISMVFQEPAAALNPLFSVGEQIREVVSAHRSVSRKEARQQALETMEAVGLPEVERTYRQYPHQLSGGMRQRVLIAGALICRPRMLIADEPTTALDVTIQAEILDLLRRMREKFGTAILYITHDLGIVAELCERVLTLYAGEAIEVGPVPEVLGRPLHPYTAGLLESMPRLDQQTPLKAIPGIVPEPEDRPEGCRFHPRCPHVEQDCRLERQALETVGPARQVRCRRWGELQLKGL